jgi:hypothetical protein
MIEFRFLQSQVAARRGFEASGHVVDRDRRCHLSRPNPDRQGYDHHGGAWALAFSSSSGSAVLGDSPYPRQRVLVPCSTVER